MSTKKTIAKSFTVSTIEDGVSVQAQYAPNANPTSGQIHTVWQTGDLYMRTRESDESAWSSWHKIVGESGDETDFSFGISQYKTTANASTAPSDISSWSDAPLAVTTAKPYLWAKVQQKSWNASTQAYVVDSTRYIRLTGEDGYTVEAQYAPNNNPTSSQIHTTWQDGDLYMRTKQSNETTWSSWHKIVGESGDETDFSFGISQYKTTANASTAPSDISSWSDAPLAVTTAKPYLWAKVQQKSWNASTQAYVVDSTRYIRLTGEDGYTVEAQYAPNNNPTSSQIHTTWQDGDLYMRTKQSNETTWSSWHKIVGESGDETDYTFNISKSLTSSNATTAPANCYYNTWQDAPIAPTSTYPYLWMKIVKKTWNESTQSYDSGTARYARITGEPGTSPYFADLNNEMDAIQCKHDGSVITDQTVSTVISMWKGSSVEVFVIDNIYRNGTKLTWDGNNNGVWPRVSGSTVSLEFTTSASIADIDDFKITIHSYNDNTVTRELHFTINGVRANAIYRLVPSHSQIVKKKDGTYVPSGNVTCSVEKTENGSTSTPSSSEYTLEKSVNGGSYTTYSATAASSITSDLKFRLKVGGVVVDLETVPLVSDGDKGNTGDSAPNAFANPAQISIPCYSNGNVKAQKVTSVIFSLNVGTHTATVTSCASGAKPTGVTVQSQADNAVTITVGTSATASGLSSGVTFTVTGTYDGKTYSATVTVALIGSTQGEQGAPGSPGGTGPRGKIGRFFYYAQEWSNSDTISYTVSDAEAPYFLYNYNYWVFNPTANGTYTMAEMGTPSSSSANWQIMTSDFKYIITEAIFGDYAHFGSAIINGDWMLSTHGKTDNESVTQDSVISGKIIKTSSTSDFSLKPYTLFLTSNPIDSLSTILESSSSYTISASANTYNITSSYLYKGYTYRLTITGKKNSSDSTVYVRIYNASYGSYQAISIPNTTNNTSIITFQVDTSATWYIQLYQPTLPSSSQGGATVSYVNFRRLLFAPKYAVDLKTGVSYQTQIYASGGLRSPFTYMTSGGSFSTDFNDNVAVYSGSETSYSLPWDASQSGRKVVITNYYWNGNYSTSSGFAKITAPSGKYFYEDGVTKSTLKLSREAVELLGYGDAINFYGWVVLKRIDLGTVSRYGHHMKMLASGRVTGSSSGASVSYHTFDGSEMSVTRDDIGVYTLSWKNNNWYADEGHVFVMVCGYGVIDGGSGPLYASVKSQTKTSITVQTADDDSRNDGAFNFFLMNFNDWIYL